MGAHSGRTANILIQAEFLGRAARSAESLAPDHHLSILDAAACGPAETTPGRCGVWRSQDLHRAMLVARKSGLRCYRIDIQRDGTISIVVDEKRRRTARKTRNRA